MRRRQAKSAELTRRGLADGTASAAPVRQSAGRVCASTRSDGSATADQENIARWRPTCVAIGEAVREPARQKQQQTRLVVDRRRPGHTAHVRPVRLATHPHPPRGPRVDLNLQHLSLCHQHEPNFRRLRRWQPHGIGAAFVAERPPLRTRVAVVARRTTTVTTPVEGSPVHLATAWRTDRRERWRQTLAGIRQAEMRRKRRRRAPCTLVFPWGPRRRPVLRP